MFSRSKKKKVYVIDIFGVIEAVPHTRFAGHPK